MRLRAGTVAFIASLHCGVVYAQAESRPSQTQSAQPEYDPLPNPPVLRIALEELAVLMAGTGYYFIQHDVNSLDWTYDYSWQTLQEKLVGEGYAFDTNYFRTNTLAHTGSGTLYYIAARGNGVGPLGSLGLGIAASTAWELLAEFRERISINDMLITPLGGAAFGETMAQVATLFAGNCAVYRSPVLHAVFAPSHALHAWIDERPVVGRPSCSPAASLAEPPLRVMMGTGFTGGERRKHGQGWALIRADARVFNFPTHEHSGQWQTYTDGNWARLSLRTALGVEGVRDIEVTARTVPFGAWYESVSGRARTVFGVGIGAMYSEHAFGGSPEPRDPLFVLEVPAFAFNYRTAYASHRFDLSLVAATSFAEVGAFALPIYKREQDVALLTPIAATRNYNHAFGVALAPELRWSAPMHELTIAARSDRMAPILRRIGDELAGSEVAVEESRRHLRAALAIGADPNWRFRTEFEWTQRRGSLGSIQRRVDETIWTTGIEGRL